MKHFKPATIRCDFAHNSLTFQLSIAGIRGQEHEVSIITKKGVEARNYDGVSIMKKSNCFFPQGSYILDLNFDSFFYENLRQPFTDIW